MGGTDAVDATSGARHGQSRSEPLKLFAPIHGDARGGGRDSPEPPLSSPTWTDCDDRSGRTETTSAASDGEDEPEDGDGPARGFRGLLRSMQRQLASLQGMTQAIAREENLRSRAHEAGRGAEKAARGDAPADEDAPGPVAEPEAESAIGPDAPGSDPRALQAEVRRLRAELAAAREENARLAAAVEKLQVCETSAPAPAAVPTAVPAAVPAAVPTAAETAAPAAASPVGNAFLDSESPQWLDGHEACQRRQHELWASVRTLALHVRTYALEARALREQRDEAEREAERAWAQNAALAGSRNPQQRIKYLQQLKTDNAALRGRIRELQTLLVGRSVARAVSDPLDASRPDASSPDLVPSCGDDPQSPSRDHSPQSPSRGDDPLSPSRGDDPLSPSRGRDRDRDVVLRRMWSRQELLRAQIERLERERERCAAAARADAETPPGAGPRAPRAERRDAARAAPAARIAHLSHAPAA